MKLKKIIIAGSIILSFCGAQAQEVKPFKNGDRVAFVGNSITEAGFYESYIWLYYMTRFPNQKIHVLNKGVGGNVSGQINQRFEKDVLSDNPTAVVLTFGMNDSKYLEYMDGKPNQQTVDAIVKESEEGYQGIVEQLKTKPSIRKIIMTSSPYDESMKKDDPNEKILYGKMATMAQIGEFQRKSAQENNWEFVDLLHPMVQIGQLEQKKNPKFTLTSNDRIHPEEAGHFVMAYLFLKSQGLDKFPVADVEIDNGKQKVVKQENSYISNLRVTTKGLYFDYLAKALPFPIDTNENKWLNPDKQSNALKVIPFNKELNREILKITNLDKGNYRVLIDDEEIGEFSNEGLANGINLAEIPSTPQYRQAYNILKLNRLRKSYEDDLRQYYWLQFCYLDEKGLLFDDSQETFDQVALAAKTNWAVASKMETYHYSRFSEIRKLWEDDMEIITNKIYQLNKPQVRQIKVQPIQ